MKYFISVAFILFGNVALAQDFLNPYENGKYVGVEYALDLKYKHGNFEWNAYKTGVTGSVNSYHGEYEIFLHKHHWRKDLSGNVSSFHTWPKSFTIEAVSFPFTPAYTNSGCSMFLGDCSIAQGTERKLKMPDMPFSSNFNGWAVNHPTLGSLEGLKRKMAGDFYHGQSQSFYLPTELYHLQSSPFRHSALVTTLIKTNGSATFENRVWYPHTVHKIIINLHCPDPPHDIVSSFSFIQDNTRGRMRYYFFSNNDDSQSISHDVIFSPELVYDYNNPHTYNYQDNSFMMVDGGTLNYFPFTEIDDNCSLSNVYDETEYFFWPPYQIFYPHPPPYSLHSTFIRSASGHYFAGYKPDPSDNSKLAIREGIKHQYGIDINFNVSDLSPDEKLLYNPAEVDITALDLYFPSGYTFKTIRGVYATLSDIALSIGVEGNYHDLRDVPVYTDLTDIDYGLTNDNPTRSSRYYIKPGAKLTIEPCVTIYDATFILQGNGQLIFQDRESTYGRFEVFQENSQFGTQSFTDQQGYTADYKLIDKQGMITRPVSLVPQGNTFLYESNDLIESGTAQQLPANLNLPITIAPETHVVFVAENEIKLTPGFHAAADHSPSGQSVFHALIWPSHCVGSGNRLMASNNNSQNNYQPQKFLYPTNPVLQPNPSRNNSRLHFSVLENSKVSVKLYNAMGQLINTPLHQNMKEKGNHIVEIKTEGLQPGIYLCTLYTEVDGSKKPMQVSRKLVVE